MFRYLGEGKLYLIDSKAALARHRSQATLKYAGKRCTYEYFWLCFSCSRDMTIQIDHRFVVRVCRKQGMQDDSEPDVPDAVSMLENINAA
jgi:hypothetical protein